MRLDQNLNYEWLGTFWFPDNESDQFSGKVSYSPDQGIKLTLYKEPDTWELTNGLGTNFLSKKLMHAIVTGEKAEYITLINVWLNPTNTTIGGPTVVELKGGAKLLIAGHLMENIEFNEILIAYDDFFNNIFLGTGRPVNDSLKLAESNPITLSSDITLKMDLDSYGELMGNVDEIDSILLSRDKAKLEKLKEFAKPIIEDGKFSFFKRKENHLLVSFNMKNKGFDAFEKVEFVWRQFWQFITDQRIFIKKISVNFPVEIAEEDMRIRRFPALYSDYGQQDSGRKAPIQQNLPININSFGQDATELNLSKIENTIQEWFRISNDDRYKPVLHGIRMAMQSKDKMVDTSRYVSLFSEIATFLDLQGEKNTMVDKLVGLYADQDWKDGILEMATCKSENETKGIWFQEIRNVIVHPSGQKKCGGKYWRVASDPFLIQKAYAHLSGLYLRAILLSLGNINKDHIGDYTNSTSK